MLSQSISGHFGSATSTLQTSLSDVGTGDNGTQVAVEEKIFNICWFLFCFVYVCFVYLFCSSDKIDQDKWTHQLHLLRINQRIRLEYIAIAVVNLYRLVLTSQCLSSIVVCSYRNSTRSCNNLFVSIWNWVKRNKGNVNDKPGWSAMNFSQVVLKQRI